MLFQDFVQARAGGNIQFLDRVRRTNILFLIFTYSTVTDPLLGDLIMENIDLEQKCAKPNFPFSAKNEPKISVFCEFLAQSYYWTQPFRLV